MPRDNHQTCLSLGTVLFCASIQVGCNKNCNVFSLSSVLCQTPAQTCLRGAMRQADSPRDLCHFFWSMYWSTVLSSHVCAGTFTHTPDDPFVSGKKMGPRLYVLEASWNQSKLSEDLQRGYWSAYRRTQEGPLMDAVEAAWRVSQDEW